MTVHWICIGHDGYPFICHLRAPLGSPEPAGTSQDLPPSAGEAQQRVGLGGVEH